MAWAESTAYPLGIGPRSAVSALWDQWPANKGTNGPATAGPGRNNLACSGPRKPAPRKVCGRTLMDWPTAAVWIVAIIAAMAVATSYIAGHFSKK